MGEINLEGHSIVHHISCFVAVIKKKKKKIFKILLPEKLSILAWNAVI